jgi:hypothetical protein
MARTARAAISARRTRPPAMLAPIAAEFDTAAGTEEEEEEEEIGVRNTQEFQKKLIDIDQLRPRQDQKDKGATQTKQMVECRATNHDTHKTANQLTNELVGTPNKAD